MFTRVSCRIFQDELIREKSRVLTFIVYYLLVQLKNNSYKGFLNLSIHYNKKTPRSSNPVWDAKVGRLNKVK